MGIPSLPLAEILERGISWVNLHFGIFFKTISAFILGFESLLRTGLFLFPPIITIMVIGGFTLWKLGRRTALLVCITLLVIWNLGLWDATIETLSLVLVSGSLSLALGVPMGIMVHENRKVNTLMIPILDYMQTTPSFVYLIPNVLFFGLGTVPGVISTIMFAFPPPVRLTALGLSQIDHEVIEAGEAFGCTRWQLLRKIKLPLALPSIMLGVNQCIMMSLSMVVIASLIGARGLGTIIIRSITRVTMSEGIEAGLAVVLIAIVLDRLSRGAFRSQKGGQGGQWL